MPDLKGSLGRTKAAEIEEMVDATGIEPVTPSMSTRCSPAELRVRTGSG